MLPLSVVEEIDRLLEEGQLSQRKIAARLGVSRGTVGAIASGRRGIYGKEPQADDPEPLFPQLPPERCSRCGYLVHMPCLVCRARDYRQRQQALHQARPGAVPPQTNRRAAPRSLHSAASAGRSRVA